MNKARAAKKKGAPLLCVPPKLTTYSLGFLLASFPGRLAFIKANLYFRRSSPIPSFTEVDIG